MPFWLSPGPLPRLTLTRLAVSVGRASLKREGGGAGSAQREVAEEPNRGRWLSRCPGPWNEGV